MYVKMAMFYAEERERKRTLFYYHYFFVVIIIRNASKFQTGVKKITAHKVK